MSARGAPVHIAHLQFVARAIARRSFEMIPREKLAMFDDWRTAREAATKYYGHAPSGFQVWNFAGLVDRAVKGGLLLRRWSDEKEAPEYRRIENLR
jgi:hypothetical protein